MFDKNHFIGMEYAKKHDFNRAVYYLSKSAELGNDNAINDIGVTYQRRERYQDACIYYSVAATKNIPTAMYNLGFMFCNGLGCERDYEKARELYEKAAKHNYSLAYKELAHLYTEGLGVEKDLIKALKYLKAGAKLEKKEHYESVECLAYLAYFYDRGYEVKRNPKKAHKMWEKCADNRDNYSMHCVAINYLEGVICKQNVQKALELLFKLAILYGYSRAFENLVKIYDEGKIVDKDQFEVEHWLLQGMSNNNAWCYIHCAEILLKDDVSKYKYIGKCSLPDLIESFLDLVDGEEQYYRREMEIYNSLKENYPDAIDWYWHENFRDSKDINESNDHILA